MHTKFVLLKADFFLLKFCFHYCRQKRHHRAQLLLLWKCIIQKLKLYETFRFENLPNWLITYVWYWAPTVLWKMQIQLRDPKNNFVFNFNFDDEMKNLWTVWISRKIWVLLARLDQHWEDELSKSSFKPV